MVVRVTPPGEDGTGGARGLPVPFNSQGSPPGDGKTFDAYRMNDGGADNLELEAQDQAESLDGQGLPDADAIDFLRLVREAEAQAALYVQQANRKAWAQSYRAFHQEHFAGSKYTRAEWRGRSKLFIPKTRAAVRKDNAAVAASLFNSVDAINCLPGNEADPHQRASAALMEELVNYRVGGRAPGKASLPWFLVAMGSRQDAVLTGVCCSKQYWLQEHRKTGEEDVLVQDNDGTYVMRKRDVYALEVDRPDINLIPPENYVIDTSADWRNPVQSSGYFIVHWPMSIDEIKKKQNAPTNPWKPLDEAILKSSAKNGKFDMEAIRRAREAGLDRMDETQTGTEFQVIWVSEVFMRTDGEDWTFYSLGDQHYLTDPKPVREVYPEQHGERPITLGYGNLESHRIYPMAPAESWQPLQVEANDLRNLMLDAVKQNVMPITKIVRGKQIDLDQVRRRSSGSSIIVSNKDDVTWENPPQVPASAIEAQRELALEFDDLAGQQNYGSVETNNALGKTLGGLKLAAGAANAVQEFDVRVWIETWTSPTLQQIVRLEQYYEADATILGICGAKAQLWDKYGINEINDHLIEQDVTVRVSIGLGAGDPQQRLAKFNTAAQIMAPIIAQSPEFQSGKKEIDIDAMCEEVFGACGYKDGGKRFFKENPEPRQNPMQDLQQEEIKAKIEKDKKTGQAALFTGIANLAKVALGTRELETNVVDQLLGRQIEARSLGHDHAHKQRDQHLSALDHGHRHGLAIANHRQQIANDQRNAEREDALAKANPEGGDAEMDSAAPSSPRAAESGAAPQAQPSASPPPQAPQGGQNDIMAMIMNGGVDFVRDAQGRISGLRPAQKQQQRAA